MNQIENNRLMWPRFEAIGQNGEHYPNSPYKVGRVIELSPIHPYSGYSAIVNSRVVSPEWFEKYPHLFKKLEWYEHRTTEEMPEYVCVGNKDIYKVRWANHEDGRLFYIVDGVSAKFDIDFFGCISKPATEAEYLAYTNIHNAS